MPKDRFNPTPFEVYYAARRAAQKLPPAQQAEVVELIRKTRSRKKTHQVLAHFQDRPDLRAWLESALYLGDGARGFAQIGGDLTPIPARSLWVCPECGFQWRVLRKGRPVPPCLFDGTPLVPAEESRDDR